MFRSLGQVYVCDIARLQLHMLLQRIEEKDIHLIPGEELIEHIGLAGFDMQYARGRSSARSKSHC